MPTKHPELGRESKMRVFETIENVAIDSPTPRNNEAKISHCKIYNRMLELNPSTERTPLQNCKI